MGYIGLMRDLLGKDIRVGDHVVYFQSWADRNIEKAIVTDCGDDHIKVKYLGEGSPPKHQWIKKKKAGKMSRFTATDKKVMIIGSSSMDDSTVKVFNDEISNLREILVKTDDKLKKSLQREQVLLEKIKELQSEIDEVANRWDILDL